MANIQIDERIAMSKRQLQEIGSDLLEASQRFGLNQETKEILEQQIINISDNFLFVIAGEVNAGKSSFVNALLGAPVSATSHEITTDRVLKITYGKNEHVENASGAKFSIREFPAEILKQITIVDTPGTNSKELDHQVITERFIPHANLIMFVFMTENIHAETAWNLFRNIKDKWGKKVVFVMTKKDMYTAEQVESYKATLRRYIENEGIEEPKIFVTSSIQEKQGELQESGFAALREYINEEVLKDAAKAKIKDDFKTLNALFNRLDDEFSIRREKFNKDQSVRNEITNIITTQEDNAHDSIKNLVEQCLMAYDKNTGEFLNKLSKEIGFISLTMREIRGIFGGEKTKVWMERMNKELVNDLNRDMNLIIENGTENIKNDIQYMLTRVKTELDKLQVTDSRPTKMFSHLDMQRNEIVMNLKHNLTNFIEKSPLFKGEKILKENIDYSESKVASGVAGVAIAIGLIAQHSVMDVTGGILTGLAMIVAGGFAQFKKGKYMREAKDTFAENRIKLKEELEGQLMQYFMQIKDSVNEQFFDFDQALKTERVQIENFDRTAELVKGKLKVMEREI